ATAPPLRRRRRRQCRSPAPKCACASRSPTPRCSICAPACRSPPSCAAPTVLLAGGDRSYFAFDVPERRKIGVGVRADSSAVECELLTAGGRSLGRGVLQLIDLEP